ncbi:MAG: arsenate reductase ArsC [Candidatus Eisenbacteria bacterium]|nr:arsenate reductase ArsC [Candidatus Eisenbacteria bacterium]
MKRVLIVCTGNACRSQMAEGLWRELGNGEWEAHSAGAAPAGWVHPLAVRAMEEIGVDISGHWSKGIDDFLGDTFDLVVTVCDHAARNCPFFPDAKARLHWPFPDPIHATGDEEKRLAAFREVRDGIRARIVRYLAEGE